MQIETEQYKYTMIQGRTYGNAAIQGVYLNVPVDDWSFFKELIRKFGWQCETREQLMERFCCSRPEQPTLTDEEIQAEVNAVRYGR